MSELTQAPSSASRQVTAAAWERAQRARATKAGQRAEQRQAAEKTQRQTSVMVPPPSDSASGAQLIMRAEQRQAAAKKRAARATKETAAAETSSRTNQRYAGRWCDIRSASSCEQREQREQARLQVQGPRACQFEQGVGADEQGRPSRPAKRSRAARSRERRRV